VTDVETSRRARVVIARTLAVPMTRLTDAADFRGDLGADSLDLVDVPHALEEEFGIRFSDDEVEFCQTVGTAIDLIKTKLENRGLTK
jgi:acyl carrier protein